MRDRSRQLVPLTRLDCKLPPALSRQLVELSPAIVLRGAVFERNPSPLNEPVERRVQRSLFDLQHIVGVEFDRFGDGVPMHWAPQQRAKVSRSRVPCSSSMRSRCSLVDILGDDIVLPVECQREKPP